MICKSRSESRRARNADMPAIKCRKQAITQACAACPPLSVVLSEMGILRQSRMRGVRRRLKMYVRLPPTTRTIAAIPARELNGSARAGTNGTPLTPEACAQRGSISGAKHGAYRAADGRRIRSGMLADLEFKQAFARVRLRSPSPCGEPCR